MSPASAGLLNVTPDSMLLSLIRKARVARSLFTDPDAAGILVVPPFGHALDPALRECSADFALPFGMVIGPGNLAIERQAVLVVGGDQGIHLLALRERNGVGIAYRNQAIVCKPDGPARVVAPHLLAV